jgi:diguanylate cyclase (GGDEF)-like protein
MSTGIRKRGQPTSIIGVRATASTLVQAAAYAMRPSRLERGRFGPRSSSRPEPLGQPTPTDQPTRMLPAPRLPGQGQRAWLTGAEAAAPASSDPILGCAGCADLREQLADALRLAYTDELTRLPNRRALDRAMDDRVAAGDGYALAFVDIDDFKAINDTLGHDTGDLVLLHLATRLRQPSDWRGWMAARLGGDEFAVLLPAMSATDAAAAAHEIRTWSEEPIMLGTQVLPRTTVGVAVAAVGETPGEVRYRADIAMYRAKRLDAGTAVSSRRAQSTPPSAGATRAGGRSVMDPHPLLTERPRAASALLTRPEGPVRTGLAGIRMGCRRVRLRRAAVASQGIRLSKVELRETAA